MVKTRFFRVLCAMCFVGLILPAGGASALDFDEMYEFVRDLRSAAKEKEESDQNKTWAHWRDPLYARSLSVGLELAKRVRYAYTDPDGVSASWDPSTTSDPTWFGGINLRVFPSKNWGIGVDGLIMDFTKIRGSSSYSWWHYGGYHAYLNTPGYEATIIKWLCDLNILCRYPLTPKFLVNAGIGLTLDATTWTVKNGAGNEIDSGVILGNPGYNWKIGVEYFVSGYSSLILEWKRQTWGSGMSREKYTISSIVAGFAWSI